MIEVGLLSFLIIPRKSIELISFLDLSLDKNVGMVNVEDSNT